MKIYEEIIAHDPSLAAHREQVLRVIEKMVEAKPAVSFDPQRKEQFDAQLADRIANRAPASAVPFSYGRMTKRAMAVSSFFLIGAVTAAGVRYMQTGGRMTSKPRQQVAVETTTDISSAGTGGEEVALSAVAEADSSMSDYATDSIMIDGSGTMP